MESSWTFEATLRQEEHILLWNSQILVPQAIADEIRRLQPDRRVIVRFPGGITHHAALMPTGDGRFFIMLNKALRKQVEPRDGSLFAVTLTLDRSEYGMPVPEEFEVVLAEDEVAYRHFNALTPGKQRALLHLIGKIKDPDLRIRKAWIIAEHLVGNGGKLDFRQLNEDFRRG